MNVLNKLNGTIKGARKGRASIREILFYLVGILAALVGITSAFIHISWIAAVLFAFSAFLSLITYFKFAPQHRADHW
jgi:uncharacterized membrane protein YfcA